MIRSPTTNADRVRDQMAAPLAPLRLPEIPPARWGIAAPLLLLAALIIWWLA